MHAKCWLVGCLLLDMTYCELTYSGGRAAGGVRGSGALAALLGAALPPQIARLLDHTPQGRHKPYNTG